jgi:NADH-quinone oxidoreductase subunit L
MPELKWSGLLIVMLPLLAGVITGLGGKRIKPFVAHSLTIAAVAVSFLLSLWTFKNVVYEGLNLNVPLYVWAGQGNITFEIGLLIDRLSLLLTSVVTFISLLVHLYSIGYMRGDPGYIRFFSYLALFTFGMLMLVMSNNFLQLFFGWEAVGVLSYLLIGFWFKKEVAISANLKAFIVNRVGDFGLMLGIAGLFSAFGTLDYATVFEKSAILAASGEHYILWGHFGVTKITFICLCLFMGAMGKSAQIPLHVWLPDSMAGPTPISALIHAATMVTAGVFMIARMSPLFEYSEVALNTILSIGAITCLLMGLVGVVQDDIKRIIAYSTLSQLGYMMMAMGVSAYGVGIFHLMTHAFFKALLFLGAGSVILALHHEQNIWEMGNLRKYMPITYTTLLLASLSMVGFPFFSGFYSKELIIEAIHFSALPSAPFAYWVAKGGVFITSLYTFRLLFVVFHGPRRMAKTASHPITESGAVIGIPLVLLAVPAVLIGGGTVPLLFKNFFGDTLFVLPSHAAWGKLANSFQGTLVMGWQGIFALPFALGVAGGMVAWFCYIYKPEVAAMLKKHSQGGYQILKSGFGFDTFNTQFILFSIRKLAEYFWRVGDQWLIDGLGVNATANSITRFANCLRKLQSGYLYHYAFMMILGFLFLIIWLMVF